MSVEVRREYVDARRVLLDALVGLRPHLDAFVLIGAQAVYLRTIDRLPGYQPFTTDADLMFDPARLADEPLLADAMTAAGFAFSRRLDDGRRLGPHPRPGRSWRARNASSRASARLASLGRRVRTGTEPTQDRPSRGVALHAGRGPIDAGITNSLGQIRDTKSTSQTGSIRLNALEAMGVADRCEERPLPVALSGVAGRNRQHRHRTPCATGRLCADPEGRVFQLGSCVRGHARRGVAG